jgi:hypothetical protein
MQHSNRQQLEQSYKEQLAAAKMSDRELFELKKNLEDYKKDKAEEAGRRGRRNAVRFYCGTIFLILLAAAAALIFYFYLQIKDKLNEEFLKQKADAPQKIEQLQETLTETQEKINQAYETYQKAKKAYEDLMAMKDASMEKINQAKTAMDEAEKILHSLKQ